MGRRAQFSPQFIEEVKKTQAAAREDHRKNARTFKRHGRGLFQGGAVIRAFDYL